VLRSALTDGPVNMLSNADSDTTLSVRCTNGLTHSSVLLNDTVNLGAFAVCDQRVISKG
jgi:hypothetical protein